MKSCEFSVKKKSSVKLSLLWGNRSYRCNIYISLLVNYALEFWWLLVWHTALNRNYFAYSDSIHHFPLPFHRISFAPPTPLAPMHKCSRLGRILHFRDWSYTQLGLNRSDSEKRIQDKPVKMWGTSPRCRDIPLPRHALPDDRRKKYMDRWLVSEPGGTTNAKHKFPEKRNFLSMSQWLH